MWYHEHLTVGTRVYRADNPCHTGRVAAIFGVTNKHPDLLRTATFRVDWDNGWREDCEFHELRKLFEGENITFTATSTRQPIQPFVRYIGREK